MAAMTWTSNKYFLIDKFHFWPIYVFFVCISLSLLYRKIDFSWLCHLDTGGFHNVFLNKVNMLFKYRPFDNILLCSSIKKIDSRLLFILFMPISLKYSYYFVQFKLIPKLLCISMISSSRIFSLQKKTTKRILFNIDDWIWMTFVTWLSKSHQKKRSFSLQSHKVINNHLFWFIHDCTKVLH